MRSFALSGTLTLPPLVIGDAVLTRIKWLALAAMTCDHVNKTILAGSVPVLTWFGRIALPLFVFVFACNLSRPGLTATACLRGREWLGALLFSVGGLLTEYWWPALLLGLAVWGYRQSPSWVAIATGVLGLAGLDWINGNHWALLSVPAVVLLAGAGFELPRLKWLFYWYYPLHLALLWIIRETAV